MLRNIIITIAILIACTISGLFCYTIYTGKPFLYYHNGIYIKSNSGIPQYKGNSFIIRLRTPEYIKNRFITFVPLSTKMNLQILGDDDELKDFNHLSIYTLGSNEKMLEKFTYDISKSKKNSLLLKIKNKFSFKNTYQIIIYNKQNAEIFKSNFNFIRQPANIKLFNIRFNK